MIDLSISILLIVIAAMLGILTLFTIYLIIQRERETSNIKQRNRYLQRFTRLWYACFFDDQPLPVELAPKSRANVEAIEIIFSSYLRNIANIEIKQKIKQYSNLYLKKFYKQDLSSKRWSVRMNALYRIADFGIDELLDTLKNTENKKISKEEYFQVLKIYSLFQPDLFFKKLKHVHENYAESEYRRLLSLLEDDIFVQFFDDFKLWPQNIQYALIDTAAVRRDAQYVHKLKDLLTVDQSETRIRVLKGLYEIGIIDEIESYVPFATSAVWEERLMVAKIFKYSPLAYTYIYLEQLMQDENWWVRMQAAATIADGRLGSAKLQHFIQNADDEYAVELAKDMLLRKQAGR